MPKKVTLGTNKKAINISGFRSRISTKAGQKILKRRQKKGRYRLTISS